MNEIYNSPSRDDLLSRIVPESDQEWVSECDKLLTEGDIDEALYVMYKNVDARLRKGQLDCDFMYEIYNTENVHDVFAIGILTITAPIDPQTDARKNYFNSLNTKLLKAGEDAERTLVGLD